MSDFAFTTNALKGNVLKVSLENTFQEAYLYQGDWGALAFTKTKYPGFEPVETEDHICIVIGGPVLYFQDNNFINNGSSNLGSLAILDRWLKKLVDWSEDLSGPFVIIIVDKNTKEVFCITDLMLLIPVYITFKDNDVLLSTHVDILAECSDNSNNFDEISLVDFVLHNAITYPFTAYENINLLSPASENTITLNNGAKLKEPKIYWQPVEKNDFDTIDNAANYLYKGVQGYIDRVCNNLDHVAQFISGGEDSRALAGMLPTNIERDAFIFIDEANRESKVAEKVAKSYGVNFKPYYRNKLHYLDILPAASELIGTGHQYTHAHTLTFEKIANLDSYAAVFGGYISDSLLKAEYAHRPAWMKRLTFLPQLSFNKENRTHTVVDQFFSDTVLGKVTKRREEHYKRLYKLRPSSAQEWFELWPATMRYAIPNLYTNRRLFASHEVFMAKESIKTAAAVPVEWKLNRRLFNKSFKSTLVKSKFIQHADGRLPYYPWWINSWIQFPVCLYRVLTRKVGLQKINPGPWGDWYKISKSKEWNNYINTLTQNITVTELNEANSKGILYDPEYSIISKVNFLQICYQTNDKYRAQSVWVFNK